jgi:hypothetical protein
MVEPPGIDRPVQRPLRQRNLDLRRITISCLRMACNRLSSGHQQRPMKSLRVSPFVTEIKSPIPPDAAKKEPSLQGAIPARRKRREGQIPSRRCGVATFSATGAGPLLMADRDY